MNKRRIKLTESDLHRIVKESVNRILREEFDVNKFFVADEGDGMYNIFSYADFDENGYYAGHEGEEGYHIDDFDIVYETSRFQNAERWVDEHMAY
ncbi:MAG: hypothetical protein J6Y37_03655 [Paludibacteraceae bacterium]|nr:hypothetical protein [Paludibacteraceae bacterium]